MQNLVFAGVAVLVLYVGYRWYQFQKQAQLLNDNEIFLKAKAVYDEECFSLKCKSITRKFTYIVSNGRTPVALRYLGYCLKTLPQDKTIRRADVDYIYKHLCESTGNSDIYHNHWR
jgi:hypothetical protein